MEDAHIANTKLDNGCSLFGVFDGHGGKYQQLYYKYPLKKNRVGGCSLRKKVLLKSSD
jgi:hypothetical protein